MIDLEIRLSRECICGTPLCDPTNTSVAHELNQEARELGLEYAWQVLACSM